MYLERGVQPSEIAMTPDRTINWQRYEALSLGGTIYRAPDCPPKAEEVLLDYVHGNELVVPEQRKNGVQATVDRVGDLAVRMAGWDISSFSDMTVGLSA